MTEIVIGTTPTITYTFTDINTSEIDTAIFTIKKQSNIVLEKDLTTATIKDYSISWTLSQEDTLSIGAGNAELLLNWVANGTRGVSRKEFVTFTRNHKNEVL